MLLRQIASHGVNSGGGCQGGVVCTDSLYNIPG